MLSTGFPLMFKLTRVGIEARLKQAGKDRAGLQGTMADGETVSVHSGSWREAGFPVCSQPPNSFSLPLPLHLSPPKKLTPKASVQILTSPIHFFCE